MEDNIIIILSEKLEIILCIIGTQVSLEDFESHVLDHFSCEDRSMDTIHNFDLMLDAPSSFDGDFG